MNLKTVVLHGPALDAAGHFRDSGSELTVVADDALPEDAQMHVTSTRAHELIERGMAVSATAEAAAQANPLDHDGDGRAGGSLPGEQSTRRRGAARD